MPQLMPIYWEVFFIVCFMVIVFMCLNFFNKEEKMFMSEVNLSEVSHWGW